MSESNEKPATFLGTYFDRDSVLRLSRWSDVLAWVILTVQLLTWLSSALLLITQYLSDPFMKGATFLMTFNLFTPTLTQAFPGIVYFFGLQALSKVLLILLDMEDNTRRAARSK